MLTPEELRDISELVEPGANIAFARKYSPEHRWRMANDLRAIADSEQMLNTETDHLPDEVLEKAVDAWFMSYENVDHTNFKNRMRCAIKAAIQAKNAELS